MPRFILSLFLVLFVSQGAFAQSAAFSPLRPNAFPPSMNGSQTQPLPQRIQAQIDAIHHQLARKGTQQTSGGVHSDGSSVTMRIIAGKIPDPAGKSRAVPTP